MSRLTSYAVAVLAGLVVAVTASRAEWSTSATYGILGLTILAGVLVTAPFVLGRMTRHPDRDDDLRQLRLVGDTRTNTRVDVTRRERPVRTREFGGSKSRRRRKFAR